MKKKGTWSEFPIFERHSLVLKVDSWRLIQIFCGKYRLIKCRWIELSVSRNNTHYIPRVNTDYSIQMIKTFNVLSKIYVLKRTLDISNPIVLVHKAISYTWAFSHIRIFVTPFINLSLHRVSNSLTTCM